MKKRSEEKSYNNRLLYSLIALGILGIFAVGIYAINQQPSSGGGTHNYTEIGIPTCSNNNLLIWHNGAWMCTSISPLLQGYFCDSIDSALDNHYVNEDEDIYYGFVTTTSSCSDTCNGDKINIYSCPPDNDNGRTSVCTDCKKVCKSSDPDAGCVSWEYSKRDVRCLRRTQIGCFKGLTK